MTAPYYQDDRVTLWHGTARERAADLEPASIDTIVTSPPYFGLRDYGHPEQIGTEDTVEEYVENLVETFAALWPALRDDGTLWLNLGDSYSTRWASVRGRSGPHRDDDARTRRRAPAGFAGKQLMMIPARVALALQDAGWKLRSEIIWAKPNPMPESVQDRPTKSHEMIYLFAKSDRYYYDGDAIREDASGRSAGNREHKYTAARAAGDERQQTKAGLTKIADVEWETRNARDVWTFSPGAGFPGAHFATFPPDLPRRCIRAGSRGVGKRCDCDEVIGTPVGAGTDEPDPSMLVGRAGMQRPRGDGAGRRPITRRQQRADAAELRLSSILPEDNGITSEAWSHYLRTDRSGARPLPAELRAIFLEQGLVHDVAGECEHPVEPAGLVLDPFSGSGTTGMVALEEGRRYAGIDVNADYLDLSLRTRFAAQPLDLGSLA